MLHGIEGNMPEEHINFCCISHMVYIIIASTFFIALTKQTENSFFFHSMQQMFDRTISNLLCISKFLSNYNKKENPCMIC